MNPAPAEPEPARPDDVVEVARIVGAWGVQGGIKVKPFSADPQALFSSKRWFVEPSQAKPGQHVPGLMHVVQAREQGDTVVATVREITDRDAAAALAGARVFVSRGSFPTPDADEFYWVDLIGLDAINVDGATLGRVVGLIETGPHCVLRIQPATLAAAPARQAKADEILIPFVNAYVGRVDLAGRTVHVDWQADY